jgi:hypothetical protein
MPGFGSWKNTRIEVWEATGIEQGDSLQNILEDFECSAAGNRKKKRRLVPAFAGLCAGSPRDPSAAPAPPMESRA